MLMKQINKRLLMDLNEVRRQSTILTYGVFVGSLFVHPDIF